jgi:hypothetical protein
VGRSPVSRFGFCSRHSAHARPIDLALARLCLALIIDAAATMLWNTTDATWQEMVPLRTSIALWWLTGTIRMIAFAEFHDSSVKP